MENLENILSLNELQNICRTCLSKGQLESIFTEQDNFSLVNMIMAIANVQVNQS